MRMDVLPMPRATTNIYVKFDNERSENLLCSQKSELLHVM